MFVSSALNMISLRQDPPPLVIGERLNVMGSAASKKHMLEHDIDGLLAIAWRQVKEEGAHCLDICMANTEGRDEKRLVLELVKRVGAEVPAPLVIDSTEHDVIAAAVRHAPGTPIINSISLEDGRFEENVETMRKYGCPAIAMCAGPAGVVKTAREKVEIAREIYGRATGTYGIKPDQLIFDPSAFTLCTGDPELRHTAVETLEAVRQIKRLFPDSYTSLGLSNISFGLKPHARRVLNSVFLYHAVRYGLDAAIINMSRITAYADISQAERVLAERVIFDKDDGAESDFINHFERSDGSDMSGGVGGSEWEGMAVADRCTYKIIHRITDGLQADVQDAISESTSTNTKEGRHEGALRVLNDSLLPAMKTVGDKFGAGELILPYVLRSAECMKVAVREIEKHLITADGVSKGTIVLGTVYGDVHDIGKNLVKTIFQNNGYTVHDLGKQVPVNAFIDKIRETGADAVGLSALLVSTSKQMQVFAEYAIQSGLEIPILCGGAAINSSYINRIATTAGPYKQGMFYCRDMFDGLHVMDRLIADKPGLLGEYVGRLSEWQKRESAKAKTPSGTRVRVKKVRPPAHIHTPHNMGLGEVRRIRNVSFSENDIWGMMDKKSLFKLSWGVRGRAATTSTVAEFERLFVNLQDTITTQGWFEPYVAYGFFRCRSSGNTLYVYGDDVVGFDFPRSGGGLCIADYFNSDRDDVVALQVVTVGSKVADVIERYNQADRYTDAYHLHGMAVEAAEGLAEYCNRLICLEWGLPKALRYSWGYPSCPDIMQHRLVWQLLRPADTLRLTDAGQITPEFSTAALVTYHPDAKYFVT